MCKANFLRPLFLLLLAFPLVAASQTGQREKLLDPTRPLGHRVQSSPSQQEESLNLQAIFFGAGRKEAIVNGKSVKEGDYVAGKKIIAIRANEVVYSSGGAQSIIKLRSSFFDKP